MKEKKGFKNTVVRPAKDKSTTMRLNHFLSNKYTVTVIVILMSIFLYLILNYIINSCFMIPQWLHDMEHPGNYFGAGNLLPNFQSSQTRNALRILKLLIIVILDWLVIYQIRTYLSDDNFNVGQKGDSRWTTLEEIQAQYKEINEKDTTYSGMPGIPISRYRDKIYIDDSTVNNLILGITRSGKGEMFVFPSIDIYSRAEIKPSMVICDPKTELYRSSKITLEKRGYDVYFFNLNDPMHSMGNNPLTEIIELYKKEDYAKAEQMAQSFAYSVYNPSASTGNDKFFDEQAVVLLTALILAYIEDCLKEDKYYNEKRYKMWERKRTAYMNLSKEEQKEETVRCEKLRKRGKDIVMEESVHYIPMEYEFQNVAYYEKDINLYSIVNTFTELARQKIPNSQLSMLDVYFMERPMLNRAKLKYSSIEIAGDRTKGSIYSNALKKLTVFTYENIAKMTAENSINLKDIGFGDRPIAIFIGSPDEDKSYHFLASVFIRQIYQVLVRECRNVNKCKRPVKFICDEFATMPAIEDMGDTATVCLGRNISFDLYVQSYTQIDKRYPDDAKTIRENCGNHIYIMTNSEETARDFSNAIGKETVTDLQRTGHKLSLKKTLTESTIEKPLLTANQLMELKEGYCVVKRVMKRRDLNGNPITPSPIYNCEEFGTKFKYRYEYLTDTFPNPDDIALDEINTESRVHINHTERVWDYEISFEQFDREKAEEGKSNKYRTLEDLNKQYQYSLKSAMENILGEDYEDEYGISESMQIDEFLNIINALNISENDKNAIRIVVEKGVNNS